jgi:flagellar biogenesis protein FliO
MIGAYLQMAIALVAVIGLILVVGILLKRKKGKPSLITVLSYQSFGPRKGIAALKIGAEILLIGITSTDLKLLKTVGEKELEPEIVSDMHDKLNKLRNIKKLLNEQ